MSMLKLYRDGSYLGVICRECIDDSMGFIEKLYHSRKDKNGEVISPPIWDVVEYQIPSGCSEFLSEVGMHDETGKLRTCEFHEDTEEED